MKSKAITALHYLNLVSFILLLSSTIFYFHVQKIFFILFVLSYFVEFFVDKKWMNIKTSKNKIYFLLMILFFLLALIYYPFESSTKYFSILVVKRLSILGFGLIGIFGLNTKFRISLFLNTFIITSVSIVLYLIIFQIGLLEFIHNPDRAQLFTNVRDLKINLHMMFNFYLNTSIIAIWYIFSSSWKSIKLSKKVLYFLAFGIIFFALSITEGRSGFLASLLIIAGILFWEIWKRKKIIGFIIGILIPFVIFGIASQKKRMSEPMLKSEPRIFLWKAALEVVKQSPVFGYGINDAQEKFDSSRTKLQTPEFKEYWKESRLLDCHDQYLQTTMEFGIVGLIILLFIYIYPIFIAVKQRKFLAFLLMSLCAYQSLFDMFITGNFSAMFGILLVIILLAKNDLVFEQIE